MPLPPELSYLRNDRRIEADLCGHRLRFDSTWGLFSPKSIDEGSRLLLEHMDIAVTDQCLDLGCGYGPLGLCMAKQAPSGRTVLLDKDFVAVDYARRNAVLNGIDNVEVILSNGFSALDDRRFDVIASNLPAKVGNELLYLFFYDALDRLPAGGRLYVVVINGLRQFIARAFREVFGNHKKLKQGKTYTVAMAERLPS